MTALPKWQRRLAAPGAILKQLSGEGEAYGVYPGGDPEQRPAAIIDRDSFLRARADGVIVEAGAGCFRLARSTEVLRQRKAGDFQTSHSITQNRAFIDEDGRIGQREINLAESPLARWMKPEPGTGRSWLSAEEYEAGERLRADYHRSVLAERVTSDWDAYLAPARSGHSRTREDAPASAYEAKARVLTALAAAGPGLDRILNAICLQETGMAAAEQADNWPRRSGKALLKLALQRLALHYGMIRKADVNQ